MVFSGDADTVINFIGTEKWIIDMNLPLITDWAPWYYTRSTGTKQVAGWTVGFKGLTFTTVKGAGHMVPFFQPAPAYQMLENFIGN